MEQLAKQTSGDWAIFDQCEYGLKIPDDNGMLVFARKRTKILSTILGITRMSRNCSRCHHNVHVLGGCRPTVFHYQAHTHL